MVSVTTLSSRRVADTLDKLHHEAEIADQAHIEEMMALMESSGADAAQVVETLLAQERADNQATYRRYANNFLAVSPAYGRFLYAMARASGATRIVEFGTSMGISAIYLAAAIRDNGGGILIGTELEPSKVTRARTNLEAAGLADLVDIREGNALDTLGGIVGEFDLLHLDGAFSLYLPVLKLVETRLRPGATILGENAFERGYLDYVRNPANGYLSQPLPLDEGRGNEFTVRAA